MNHESMTGTFHGCHLIAGEWVSGVERFTSSAVTGTGHAVSVGTAADVDRAAEAAEAAFRTFGWSSQVARATFLERIADEIEARADTITAVGSAETGLPEERLLTECGRTIGQLRLVAAVIRDGEYLDRRHDPANPERKPLPKPKLVLVQRPVAPVLAVDGTAWACRSGAAPGGVRAVRHNRAGARSRGNAGDRGGDRGAADLLAASRAGRYRKRASPRTGARAKGGAVDGQRLSHGRRGKPGCDAWRTIPGGYLLWHDLRAAPPP